MALEAIQRESLDRFIRRTSGAPTTHPAPQITLPPGCVPVLVTEELARGLEHVVRMLDRERTSVRLDEADEIRSLHAQVQIYRRNRARERAA